MDNLVIIASSTGGPSAINILVKDMGRINACVIIVQHMPLYINESFVRSLAKLTPMSLRIAEMNDPLIQGQILVAPSARHCVIAENGRIVLSDERPVNFVRPSADVTMLSVTPRTVLGRLAAVVLTGMGRDGATGLAYMKGLGAVTIAQDKASSAVYGMPAEAFKTGKVDQVLPIEKIGPVLARLF
jgi:two-component system chemotaxis response regulator CheB